MWPTASITLEHVRLRGVRSEPVVARLRLASLLASSSLQPPAMPPAAVLVVRCMADPLPGRIAGELKPAAVAGAAWEHAAQDRLGGLYARAARPAWGAVPASAKAVLFSDSGELLACLAADLSSGAGLGWWWQSLRRRFTLGLPGAWPRIWEEHPEYVPAALEHLAARSQAAAILERIAPLQAWRLLRAVARAFGLSGSAIPENPAATPTRASPPLASPPTTPVTRDLDYRVPLPWTPYVQSEEVPAVLGVAKGALLGVGLLLRRAPQVALADGFTFRFRAWLAAEERTGGERPDVEGSVARASPNAEAGGIAGRAADARDGSTGVRRRVMAPGADRSAKGDDVATQVRPGFSLHTREPAAAVPVSNGERFEPRRRPPAEWRADWEAGQTTRAGGVLYLIHLLRQLGLVREFDTGLSGWALLELLARCLLGASIEAVAADPIWSALAELDERDPCVPAGTGFQDQDDYAAPESWLARLAQRPLLARFRSRGMELWRPEGFLVFDSRRHQPPAGANVEPFTRSARRRLRAAAEVRPAHLSLSPELRRFLRFVLPYARWRLGAVLRGTSMEEACLRPGRLILTSSHVDLVMGMRQISVPVRMAGLDANPGWVPELGRVITFHFVAEGLGGE